MPFSTINFVGEAYQMKATQLDAQTCINWYVTIDKTGKVSQALLPRPALDLYADDDNENSVRGILSLNGVLYAVIDNKFYEYYTNGTRISRGTLNTSSGRVFLISNGIQVFISDSTYGYVYQIVANDAHPVTDFYIITATSSQVGQPRFLGVGVNDLVAFGTYSDTTNRIYLIKIDSVGSPDTFRWSDDNGSTWTTGIAITGAEQTLSYGVKIIFEKTSGHVLDDIWIIATTGDDSFYVPIHPTYQDTYGIYPKQNSERFYISGISDFSRVNALDFAITGAAPDNLVAALSVHQELWMFNNVTTEIWYDTGNADFPFERRTNLVINYGCIAPFSIRNLQDNIILFFGQNKDGNKVVISIEEYIPTVVSTEPMDEEFSKYETITDAFAFVLERNGHVFYILTFPTEDKTWVYDITTKAWTQWTSERDNPITSGLPTIQGRYRGNCHAIFDGKHIIGDYKSGKLFTLTDDSSLDYDTPITCERTAQHIPNKLNILGFYSLQVDFEAGVGTVSGEGHDPKAMLQVSRDGGKSWGNEMWRSIGKTGKYRNRALWYKLGSARVFTFRLRIDDPVYKVVLGAVGNVEGE